MFINYSNIEIRIFYTEDEVLTVKTGTVEEFYLLLWANLKNHYSDKQYKNRVDAYFLWPNTAKYISTEFDYENFIKKKRSYIYLNSRHIGKKEYRSTLLEIVSKYKPTETKKYYHSNGDAVWIQITRKKELIKQFHELATARKLIKDFKKENNLLAT